MKKKQKQGRVIVVSGPSGAGKTTLHDMLLKSPVYAKRVARSVSATTRLPRGKEKHGREYFFFSRKMFEHKIRTRQFLEWARVFDKYYGTPLKNVRNTLKTGRHVLLCIDVQGGRNVKKIVPDAFMVFVKPPSMAELRRRLEKRGTDSKESVALRLKTAAQELKQAKFYDAVIVNDDLARAFADFENVLKKAKIL